MELFEHNRDAWNLQSTEGCRWSTPYPDEQIERAARGDWSVVLTPNKPVPSDWFPGHPRLDGLSLLALASGGGQQVPLFAAAGAEVVTYDASEVQLQKDLETCARHGLSVTARHGDMADLDAFDDTSFDLVFNPVSNVFAERLDPIWRECHRVLRPGGRLLTGFMNPAFFLFDHRILEEEGRLVVRHRLPYNDFDHAEAEDLADQLESRLSVEFSHSWEAQIGGQCRAGFAITAFYEDDWDAESTGLHGWLPLFAATCAVKWIG